MCEKSALIEILAAYRNLSIIDRAVFYSTVSNDIDLSEDHLQSFLIETRITEHGCIYCGSSHVVKNGKRKDGTQRFLCRDCRRSFIASSRSVTSRTRKKLSVWTAFLRCMLERKTLKDTAEECGISVTTAFFWRHKILDALHDMAESVYLDGIVEADETYFNLSYKGRHSHFTLPRPPHKRGNSVHTKGLSSEKVCVPCAVNDSGISYAKPAKLGKVSSACISKTFDGVISPQATLCTDHEKAYLDFAGDCSIKLIQTDTDCRTTIDHGHTYGIQRINAYHSNLKSFIRGFRGVSTKYLENYIVWNDLIVNNRRMNGELLSMFLAQVLIVRMNVYNKSIPQRPPVPAVA